MKYLDEFKNSKLGKKLAQKIRNDSKDIKLNFMEVCGTHTVAIARAGIKSIIGDNINLVSGPGCPVCVTPADYVEKAIYLSGFDDVIITTFGDMLRVPGNSTSLLKEKAQGRDIRILYSPFDALEIAEKNPGKKIVFLGIGFETTSPTIAMTVIEAKKRKLKNFFVLTAFKIIPNALEFLADDKELELNGLICPGHLSVITGYELYQFLPEKYHIPCVVSGFEPLDILQTISMLVNQNIKKEYKVENEYSRLVTRYGNKKALDSLKEVFVECESNWRGVGTVPGSGLKLNKKYSMFDAEKKFDIKIPDIQENKGCICGLILRGRKKPTDCPLYKTSCNPTNPIGACMVSSEGTCAAYYRY